MHEEELRKVASLREKRHHSKDNSAKDGGLFGIFHRHSKRESDLLRTFKPLKPKSVANNMVLTPPDSEQELNEKQESPHEALTATAKPPTLDTIFSELIILREQHKQLTTCFQALLHLDGVNRPLSPLSATMEEEAEENIEQPGNQPSPSVSQIFEHHRSPTRASRLSRRTSIGTTDTSIEWFDAVDGSEEFIIPPESEDRVVENGDDSDSEAEATGDGPASEFMESVVVQKKKEVRRRTKLPAPVTGDEMSLLAVLKKNVGKVREYSLVVLNLLIFALGPRYHLSTSFLQRTDFNSPTARRRLGVFLSARSSSFIRRSNGACLAHCCICHIWIRVHAYSRRTKAV
jgi:hypothetical protein